MYFLRKINDFGIGNSPNVTNRMAWAKQKHHLRLRKSKTSTVSLVFAKMQIRFDFNVSILMLATPAASRFESHRDSSAASTSKMQQAAASN